VHQRESSWAARRKNEFGLLSHQFFRLLPDLRHVCCGPAIVDSDVSVLHPPKLLQPVPERRDPCLCFLIALGIGHQHADAPHTVPLLRPRRERPCGWAAEQRDELAALHSITSSARASSVGGTSMPIALAALRLMTSSYLVGACTGRSAGFSPLRIRSTYWAAERNWLARSDPYDIRPPALTK